MPKSRQKLLDRLIISENVDTFLFGSKSEFDRLCVKIVTDLKEKYPHIKRIYVRSSNQHIPDWYKNYLLEDYDDTFFPENIVNAGKASYVELNQEMINKSDICVIYYDESYLPPRRKSRKRELTDYQPKSGTAVAYKYAVNKSKRILNIYSKNFFGFK